MNWQVMPPAVKWGDVSVVFAEVQVGKQSSRSSVLGDGCERVGAPCKEQPDSLGIRCVCAWTLGSWVLEEQCSSGCHRCPQQGEGNHREGGTRRLMI